MSVILLKTLRKKGYLSIGACESAWLADLVVAHVLEKTQECLQPQDMLKFYGDDGWAVFKRKLSYPQMIAWMDKFQDTVNTTAEGDYLKTDIRPVRDSKHGLLPHVHLTSDNKWDPRVCDRCRQRLGNQI